MIAGVLLAAGGARRFHSQKLVAMLNGQPVVRHAASALAGATDSLVVVVGHEGSSVAEALRGLDAKVVENPSWELGLATSLKRGVEAVAAKCDAVIVAAGDQPGLDDAVVRAVIERWRETGLPIVSARYRGVGGHPVLFARSTFAEVAALAGDAGARLLIERSPDRVAYVEIDAPMPKDVDTTDDLAALDGGAPHHD